MVDMATACPATDAQRLRAFRHYVRLLDVGHWGANYLLFFEEQAEPTRAKVVIVDDGGWLQLYWAWSESGKASMPSSAPPSSMRPGHLACIEQHLPRGAVLSSVLFLGLYREVAFEELIPLDAPPEVDSPRFVLSTVGRVPVNRNSNGVTVCVRHEPPFWEIASRYTRFGGTLGGADPVSELDRHSYWVELPVLTPANGVSILQEALNWLSVHPHLPSVVLDSLLVAVRNKLAGKPAPPLELLHAADEGSLLPSHFEQYLEVALLARIEFEDNSLARRLTVGLSVNELVQGGRGRTERYLAGVHVAVEVVASRLPPCTSGMRCRTLPFSLEVTVSVAFVTSTTQQLSMVGDFLIDENRIALSAVRQRGGATMQSFFRCSDPMRVPAVECAIASVQTVLR